MSTYKRLQERNYYYEPKHLKCSLSAFGNERIIGISSTHTRIDLRRSCAAPMANTKCGPPWPPAWYVGLPGPASQAKCLPPVSYIRRLTLSSHSFARWHCCSRLNKIALPILNFSGPMPYSPWPFLHENVGINYARCGIFSPSLKSLSPSLLIVCVRHGTDGRAGW